MIKRIKKSWLVLPVAGILGAGFLSCCSLPLLAGLIISIAGALGISMGLAKGLLFSALIALVLFTPVIYQRVYKSQGALPGSACECPPSRISLLTFLLAGSPLLLILFFLSLNNGLAQKAEPQPQSTVLKVSLPVYGMTCEACGKIILNQFETVRNIESYEADISNEEIHFSFKGEKGDLELLLAKIHEMGLTTGAPEIK